MGIKRYFCFKLFIVEYLVEILIFMGFFKYVFCSFVILVVMVVENKYVCCFLGMILRILLIFCLKFMFRSWFVLFNIKYLIVCKLKFLVFVKWFINFFGVFIIICGCFVSVIDCVIILILFISMVYFNLIFDLSVLNCLVIWIVSFFVGDKMYVNKGCGFFSSVCRIGRVKVVVLFDFVCVSFMILCFLSVIGIVFIWIWVGVFYFRVL